MEEKAVVSEVVGVMDSLSKLHESHLAEGGLPPDLIRRAQASGIGILAILALVLKHGPQAVEVLKTILDLLAKGKKVFAVLAFLAICGAAQADRAPRPQFVPRPVWASPVPVQVVQPRPVYFYPVASAPIWCST